MIKEKTYKLSFNVYMYAMAHTPTHTHINKMQKIIKTLKVELPYGPEALLLGVQRT